MPITVIILDRVCRLLSSFSDRVCRLLSSFSNRVCRLLSSFSHLFFSSLEHSSVLDSVKEGTCNYSILLLKVTAGVLYLRTPPPGKNYYLWDITDRRGAPDPAKNARHAVILMKACPHAQIFPLGMICNECFVSECVRETCKLLARTNLDSVVTWRSMTMRCVRARSKSAAVLKKTLF